MTTTHGSVRGRCLVRDEGRLLLRGERGAVWVEAEGAKDAREGDLVEVTGGRARVVARPRRPLPPGGGFTGHVLDARRMRALEVRDRVEAGIAEFFAARGFRAVRTPVLVPCPGMEPHLETFRVEAGGFLPTSPELAMKRLLVGGLERIFQVARAFRAEPASRTHHPEFTLLEWYRAYAGLDEILADTEELVAFLAVRENGRPALRSGGVEVSVEPPWPRWPTRDLFREHAGVDVARDDLAAACRRLGIATAADDDWDALYFRIWLARVEPRLPADRAVFVTDYPPSQAALAVIETHADGTRTARRAEAYLGGIELANGFEELTDPDEQRARFEHDAAEGERLRGGPRRPIDEEFLTALEEGMPPAGGIALGVDRLVMLLADEPDLHYTVWLPPSADGSPHLRR